MTNAHYFQTVTHRKRLCLKTLRHQLKISAWVQSSFVSRLHTSWAIALIFTLMQHFFSKKIKYLSCSFSSPNIMWY